MRTDTNGITCTTFLDDDHNYEGSEVANQSSACSETSQAVSPEDLHEKIVQSCKESKDVAQAFPTILENPHKNEVQSYKDYKEAAQAVSMPPEYPREGAVQNCKGCKWLLKQFQVT